MANQAAQTAYGPMSIVAIEQHYPAAQRLVQMAPERVAAFLGEYGWKEWEQMGSQEFIAQYVKPSGRALPVTEIERAAYAEKM